MITVTAKVQMCRKGRITTHRHHYGFQPISRWINFHHAPADHRSFPSTWEYDLKNIIYAQYQKLSAKHKQNRQRLANRISEDVSKGAYVHGACHYVWNQLITLFAVVILRPVDTAPATAIYSILSIAIYGRPAVHKVTLVQYLSNLNTISQELLVSFSKACSLAPQMNARLRKSSKW
jgi:hypothetical protein